LTRQATFSPQNHSASPAGHGGEALEKDEEHSKTEINRDVHGEPIFWQD